MGHILLDYSLQVPSMRFPRLKKEGPYGDFQLGLSAFYLAVDCLHQLPSAASGNVVDDDCVRCLSISLAEYYQESFY